MLLGGLARVVTCQMLRLPGAECRTDFVPVLDCGLKVAQHPRLEVAEVADLDRQWLLEGVAHAEQATTTPKARQGFSDATHPFNPFKSGTNFSWARIMSCHVTALFL